MTVVRLPLAERFWRHVDKSDECWLWTGAHTNERYGGVSVGGRMRTAHRVSYELAHGDGSADGMLVCHHCDNGMCVRPDHLFLGTQKDNMRDMRDKGRARYTGAKNPVRGEAHPCAVLSDEEVRWMRWARDYSGAEYRDIGAKMGVSGTAAHKAIKGKRARWA